MSMDFKLANPVWSLLCVVYKSYNFVPIFAMTVLTSVKSFGVFS